MGMSREEYEVRKSLEVERVRSRKNSVDLLGKAKEIFGVLLEPTDEEVKRYSGVERSSDYRRLFLPKSDLFELIFFQAPIAPPWWSRYASKMTSFPIPYTNPAPAPATPPPKNFLTYSEAALAVEAREVSVEQETPSFSETSPDYTHYLTGYRCWDLVRSGLASIGNETQWPKMKALEAVCRNDEDHDAPDLECDCGIWAFKTLSGLVDALDQYSENGKIIGQVALWGNVVETEHGWRAQYAYPLELWIRDPSQEEIAARYGCMVREAFENKSLTT